MGHKTSRPSRWARVARFISTALLLAGVLLLVAAGGLQAYTIYAQTKWQREQQALVGQFVAVPTEQPAQEPTPTETVLPSATATPSALPSLTPQDGAAVVELTPAPPTATPTATRTRQPTATATPDNRSDPGVLFIPKLGVTEPIVSVPLVNGQWDITKIIYEIALLGGTGFPGRNGNAALSAHVSLKGRGDGPFRWLEKLIPGDEIIVRQGNTRYTYRVQSARTVTPTDVSVLAPTKNATLTLITCTDWDYLKVEYTHRLIVTAALSSQQTLAPASQ